MKFSATVALLAQLLPAAATQRTFNFELTFGNIAQDGVTREMILINGASPGPVIDINEGDTVDVIVQNSSPENTTIHFHGIEMHRTPWSDGVPGVTQRNIMPGETFTYSWTATQYGSYWYHSHYRGHIEDGLYGAIKIRPSSSHAKPFSAIAPSAVSALQTAEASSRPLIISDLTHLTSHEKWDATLLAETEVSCYDSVVFNGKGSVQCIPEEELEASLTETQEAWLGTIPGSTLTDKGCVPAEVMDFLAGDSGSPELMPEEIFEGCTSTVGSVEIISASVSSWVAIDFIGANNFMIAAVSIDEHDVWVYAVDGTYIVPQRVQAFHLFNGDRISVFVQTKSSVGAFKIRVASASAPQTLIGHAILRVGGANTGNVDSDPHLSIVGTPLSSNVVFLDYAAAVPWTEETIPLEADDFWRLDMRLDGASYLWALNNTRLMPDIVDQAAVPSLFNPQPFIQNDVTISTLNNTWVDLVFQATGPMPPHPVHKHGNKMYHIGTGQGTFEWDSVNEAIAAAPELFNLDNPPKLDAVMTPPAETGPAWTAIRYHVTDPGAWLLHCHIHNHAEGGMLVLIQDGVDQWPTIPQEYWDFQDASSATVNSTRRRRTYQNTNNVRA
jgi:FtsP/CotA-like multicopper oxidase with cupredoxin domain